MTGKYELHKTVKNLFLYYKKKDVKSMYACMLAILNMKSRNRNINYNNRIPTKVFWQLNSFSFYLIM